MKDVVEIKSLFRESEKYADQEIVVEGWVRTNRGSNKFGFIELNDGTFFKSVQVVYRRNSGRERQLRNCFPEQYDRLW